MKQKPLFPKPRAPRKSAHPMLKKADQWAEDNDYAARMLETDPEKCQGFMALYLAEYRKRCPKSDNP